MKLFLSDDVKEHEALQLFEQRCEAVVGILGARLRVARLKGADLLTYLHRCTTGQNYRVGIPQPASFLDCYLASQDLVAGYTPELGEQKQRTISLTGYPTQSMPAMLDWLGALPITYRWNTRFTFLDAHEARKQISTARRNWDANSLKVIDKIFSGYLGVEPRFENLDAKNLATDANEALTELDSGAVRYGELTATLVLYDEDETRLERIAKQFVIELQNRQFPARIETRHALSAFLATLPGITGENLRGKPVNSLNIAHLIPATTIWPGLEYNPCQYFPEQSPALFYAVTTGHTPFRFNVHYGDVGHALMIGPTRAGKTTHNNFMMAQWARYANGQVFCFDRGGGAELTTVACGGLHLDLGNEAGLRLCPLAYIDDEGERVGAVEWLETCLQLQGINVSVEQRKALYRAAELLARENDRSMSQFIILLQDQEMREALKAYTVERGYGWLFDGLQDDLQHSHFTTFDLTRLMELGDKFLIPALLQLFRAVGRRLDGRPTYVSIEEGWMALLKSTFGEQLVQWLRMFGAKNAAVLLITHSLSDLAQSPHRELFLQMCMTKIYLPNAEATSPHVRRLYEECGLGSRMIQTISEMIPQRDYFYTSPAGHRVYQLGLGT